MGPYVGFGSSIADSNDLAQQGYWGAAPGATVDLTTFAAGTGTSLSMSTVANFATGTAANADVIDFSVGAWGVGAISNGLVTGGGAQVTAGADAVIGTQTAGTTVAGTVDLVELTDHTFANANALAAALEGSEHLILTALGTANNSHLLVAYSTGTAVRIADVDIQGTSLDTQGDTVIASDMVQLTGVTSVTSVVAHNVHFVA